MVGTCAVRYPQDLASEDRVICTDRLRWVSHAHAVRNAAIALLLVPFTAAAEPRWRLDLSARGIASVELDDSASQTREGIVPAFGVRALRRVGAFELGGMISAGVPAYYGKTEAALSLDHEEVISDGSTRVTFATGVDAGVGLLYFDAPPETPAMSDALIYWGPLARARLQLHVLDVLPNRRAVGLVVGANAAITSARYMSPSSGAGLRLEPELEVGLTMRL